MKKVFVALLFMASAANGAQRVSDETVRYLHSTCEIWNRIKYTNPTIYTGGVDWDAALIATLPAVIGAKSDADFASAIRLMLTALNDPATYVRPAADRSQGPIRSLDAQKLQARGILLVDASTSLKDSSALTALAAADSVVIDLRAGSAEEGEARHALVRNLLPYIIRSRITTPQMRSVARSGYQPQRGTSSGGYYAALEDMLGDPIAAAKGVSAAKRVVVVVNENSAIPLGMVTMHRLGYAAFVAEGHVSDRQVVPQTYLSIGGLDLALRWSEFSPAGDCARFRPDIELPAGGDPVAAILTLFSKPWSNAPCSNDTESDIPLEERTYEGGFPDLQHRLLSLFRLWGVFEYFYPYREALVGWPEVIANSLGPFMQADDAIKYGRAILNFASHVQDGHVRVASTALRDEYGTATPPIILRRIEEKILITDVLSGSTGLSRGDILLAVDGVPAETVAETKRHLVIASNEDALQNQILALLLRGPRNSTVVLDIDSTGGRRSVTVTRSHPFFGGTPAETPLPFRMIGDFAYVDLTRLTREQVSDFFNSLNQAKGIVFDGRGYPKGTAWKIAPLLAKMEAPIATTIFRPEVRHGDKSWWYYEQRLPAAPKEALLFKGPTVMLVDDRTISQAEHTGLFLAAANGTKFVGSRTAGANGDVTNTVLPGGVVVPFTGQAIKHPDGRPLQMVGLPLAVEVRPTIKGLRAGKDEVLHAGLELLRRMTAER